MKHIIYTIAIVLATAWGYEFKHVQAQAQSATPLEIADANMLPAMKPTRAKVSAKRVWSADLQFEYYWKPGTPTGARTQEFIYKRYIILGTTSDGGYWTTPKIPIDAENVLNLDSLLKVRGFLQGLGWKARADADSVRLVNEIARAIAAENSKANQSFVSSINSRLVTDSAALRAEVLRATSAEALKANQSYVASLAARIVADSLKLLTREPIINPGTTSQYWRGDKTWQTLPSTTVYYGASGVITQPVKKWVANGIVPTTANGYSIDISSAGFTTILSCQLQVFNNSSVVASVPIISGKSVTNTAITVNIVGSNSNLISILGTTVTGLAFFTPLTGVTLSVEVTGY